MAKNIGKIVQVIGPVVDIRYAAGAPALNNAVVVDKGEGQHVTVEVAQHRRRRGPVHFDGVDRRSGRGMDCLDTSADQRAGRSAGSRPDVQRPGR